MRLVLIAVVSTFAFGCDSPDIVPLFEESFEGCDGVCGKQAGDGTVDLMETFHPAEFAARFDGPVTLELSTDFTLAAGCQHGLFVTTTCRVPYNGEHTEVHITGDTLELVLSPGESLASVSWFRDTELDIEHDDTIRIKRVVVRNRRQICAADQLQVFREGDC